MSLINFCHVLSYYSLFISHPYITLMSVIANKMKQPSIKIGFCFWIASLL
jgi:hypothetical protein